MSETEIQPPATLQGCVFLIVNLLLISQFVPFPLTLLVPPEVVCFCEQEQQDAQKVDDDQVPIACLVERLVLVQVDVGRDDAAALNHHLYGYQSCATMQDSGPHTL